MLKETSLFKKKKQNSFSIGKNKSGGWGDFSFLSFFILFPIENKFVWTELKEILAIYSNYRTTRQCEFCFLIRFYKGLIYGIFLPAIHFLGHFYFVHNFLYTHIDQTNPTFVSLT